MERSYSALKAQLREGIHPPGYRLEANRIADEFGVSITPIRDALNRLVGEELVVASSGEGFHVPRLSEADLRDLYEWHSALIVMATRTIRSLPEVELVGEAITAASPAEAASACFSLLAERVPNGELRAAILNAGDRLHPFRLAEDVVLAPKTAELEELLAWVAGQSAAIRRYHAARMRAVPNLLRARAVRK
jgi:DNA-binding GntR family transcriptional regulator